MAVGNLRREVEFAVVEVMCKEDEDEGASDFLYAAAEDISMMPRDRKSVV